MPATHVGRILPLNSDPPDLRRYRRLLNPWFTLGAADDLEPRIREFTTALIDDFIESGRCDLVRDLANPLPANNRNTVEERVSETLRDRREESGSPEAERGLWADQLVELVRAGGTSESILEALRSVEVEPVFTAHPTEAARRSILTKTRAVAELLDEA